MAVFMVNSCKFRGCNLIFETLAELIQHIEEAHIGKLTFLAHHHSSLNNFILHSINHYFYINHHDHSTLLPHSSSLISSLHTKQVLYYHHLYILSVICGLSIIILIFHKWSTTYYQGARSWIDLILTPCKE